MLPSTTRWRRKQGRLWGCKDKHSVPASQAEIDLKLQFGRYSQIVDILVEVSLVRSVAAKSLTSYFDGSPVLEACIGLIALIEKSHASLAQFRTETKYASLWGERGCRILT